MTPSRTVAICGQRSGLTIVAMMLPPNAGRIWYRRSSYLLSEPGLGVLADVEVGAVGRQARPDRAGHAGREVAADGRRAEDDDLRPVLFDQGRDDLGERVRLVVRQARVLAGQDAVGPVTDEALGVVLDLRAQEDRRQADLQAVGQLPALRQEFQADVVELAVVLLGHDPHVAFEVLFDHRSLFSSLV